MFKGSTYDSLDEQVDGNHYKKMKIQPAYFINENNLLVPLFASKKWDIESGDIVLDKKNIFLANKNNDITNEIIKLIDDKIK